MWKIIALMLFSFAAFADTPPKEMLEKIASTTIIVHDKRCLFHGVSIDCLILADEKNDVFYLILYNDRAEINQIVAVKDKKEYVLWKHASI